MITERQSNALKIFRLSIPDGVCNQYPVVKALHTDRGLTYRVHSRQTASERREALQAGGSRDSPTPLANSEADRERA